MWEKKDGERTALINSNKGTAARTQTHTHTHTSEEVPSVSCSYSWMLNPLLAGGISDVRWSRSTQLDGSGPQPIFSWVILGRTNALQNSVIVKVRREATLFPPARGDINISRLRDLLVSTLPVAGTSKRDGSCFSPREPEEEAVNRTWMNF